MKYKKLLFFVGMVVLTACSSTKFVPDGSYLLDKVVIKADTKEINTDDLSEYLRQNTNSSVFGLFRMQLGIYNMSGRDSTKWINRTLKRIGQAPEILDNTLTSISARQLQLYYVNKGFMNTTVETDVQRHKKKATLTYKINAGKPYKLTEYEVNIKDSLLNKVATDSANSMISRNMNFDQDLMNSERDRIAGKLRQGGYYNFTRELLEYVADSADHSVHAVLGLRDYIDQTPEKLQNTIFKKYYVSKVIYRINPSVIVNAEDVDNQVFDTITRGNYTLITPPARVLTLGALESNTYIEPNKLYSDRDVQRTYSALNSLGPVKYLNISFLPQGEDSLQCFINISPAKTFSVSTQMEATFTEGYWGMATNVGTVNRNLFKGAEVLNLQGRLGLEWQNNVLAREWGGQVGLKIPRVVMPLLSADFKKNFQGSTEYKTTYRYQFRPNEFTVTNIGGGMNYNWNSNNQTHRFDLFDLSYVYFPEISDAFRTTFLSTGKYNLYNYENHLILRMGYANSFSGFNENRPMRNYSTYRYSFESAGNLLYGLGKLFNIKADVDGYYKYFNIRYSQYVRGEGSYTYNQVLDKNNKLVYHAGLGLGVPYGNGDVIPFERRFYSGGANSVRGWSESTLGPGSYQRITERIRDYNQVGDIKLDLNFEYRTKLFWVLEGALFYDAGNIWTIRDYSYQPGGVFKPESFYEQIAMAYGFGVRMDFSFFLLRFDIGAKLYDPAQEAALRWRFLPQSNDVAFHIAIGYPF